MSEAKIGKEKPAKSTLAETAINGLAVTERWCYQTLPNDPVAMDDVIHIGRDAIIMVNKSFLLSLGYDRWGIPPIIFSMYFESIMEHIMSKTNTNPAGYSINICNCFQVGYLNNTNKNNEKIGNIAPFVYHRGLPNMVDLSKYHPAADSKRGSPPEVISKSDANMCNRIVSEWSTLNPNVTLGLTSAEVNALDAMTLRKLKAAGVRMGSKGQVLVLPIVISFYVAILNRLVALKQAPCNADLTSISINVLGYFNAIIQVPEDPADANHMGYYISFAPTNNMKLKFKNDVVAGNVEED